MAAIEKPRGLKRNLALLLPLGGLCRLLLSLNNAGLIIPNRQFHKSLDHVDPRNTCRCPVMIDLAEATDQWILQGM